MVNLLLKLTQVLIASYIYTDQTKVLACIRALNISVEHLVIIQFSYILLNQFLKTFCLLRLTLPHSSKYFLISSSETVGATLATYIFLRGGAFPFGFALLGSIFFL